MEGCHFKVSCINPFQTNVHTLYPLKLQKTKGFLMISRSIKWEHWSNVYVALRDLVPFAQFKKGGKHPWRNVT